MKNQTQKKVPTKTTLHLKGWTIPVKTVSSNNENGKQIMEKK